MMTTAGSSAQESVLTLAGEPSGSFADPVFVLCNGRSGSTLLRFLLDAHPELACPPETNLPGLCVQLATVWSLIEGAPLSANRGDEPPEVPEAAIAGVRETMNRMVGSYLARRGKRRYCDKSLGTARYAELLSRVYPDARFICLYRHPMDVIASGVEACPWGLNGYGFEPYISATPGNVVLALANFWTDNVRVTLAAEERFASQCFRLRYEDLVADPEAAAAALFEFLGVSPAPGISEVCFSGERERFGPADYKIWYTSKISSESVGRGWSVPAGMIPPQLLGAVNELAGRLGYVAVDGEWGTTEPPADLRVPITAPSAADESQAADAGQDGSAAGDEGAAVGQPVARDATAADAHSGPADKQRMATSSPKSATGSAEPDCAAQSARKQRPATLPEDGQLHSRRLGERLRAALATASEGQWEPHASERIVAVAVTKDPQCPAEYWLVDLEDATVARVSKEAQEDSDWDMIATVGAWEQIIDGAVNLSVMLRSCQLRYCDNGEASPLAADSRVAIMAQLLGLVNWR